MNKVILTGNLCNDIELSQTQSGKEVVSNCVAVKRDFKNSNGEYESDFINIVVWGASATYLSKYGHKGDRVEIVGRWRADSYEDRNGDKRTAHKCKVEQISVFSKQTKEETKAKPVLEEVADEDLPF